jgi:hypothetical protein
VDACFRSDVSSECSSNSSQYLVIPDRKMRCDENEDDEKEKKGSRRARVAGEDI